MSKNDINLNTIKFWKDRNYSPDGTLSYSYIHSYSLDGLNDLLSSYQDLISNPNQEFENNLNTIFKTILNRFYVVGPTWELDSPLQVSTSVGNDFINNPISSMVGLCFLNPPSPDKTNGLQFFPSESKKFIIKPQSNIIYMLPGWLLYKSLDSGVSEDINSNESWDNNSVDWNWDGGSEDNDGSGEYNWGLNENDGFEENSIDLDSGVDKGINNQVNDQGLVISWSYACSSRPIHKLTGDRW